MPFCSPYDGVVLQALFKRQAEHWDTVLAYLSERFSISLRTSTELYLEQCPNAVSVLHRELSGLDRWRLAALDSVAGLARSYMLAIAYVHRKLTPKQLFDAARLEEHYQVGHLCRISFEIAS
jgi:ATP synthase F1 complex assembly factor 2